MDWLNGLGGLQNYARQQNQQAGPGIGQGPNVLPNQRQMAQQPQQAGQGVVGQPTQQAEQGAGEFWNEVLKLVMEG